jgi:feruloyl-CoA synthase
MASALPFRDAGLGSDHLDYTKDSEGVTRAKTSQPLQTPAQRMSDRLCHWAHEAPDRIFLAKRDATGAWRTLTYGDALHKARAIGQGLLNRRLSADRPVLILSDNDIEHALLSLGCLYAGVPFAPLSPAYSLLSKDFDKLKHVANLLSPGLVFASDGVRFEKAVKAALPDDVEFIVTANPALERSSELFSLIETTTILPEIDAAHAATGPDTIAKFLFTSGSTSMPKAVINTNHMWCSNQQMIRQCWPVLGEAPPVFLDWLPWNHTFGGNHNFGMILNNGGTLYIDDGKPTPDLMKETLRNLREIAPTIYFSVPKGWEELSIALQSDAVLRDNYYSKLRLQFFAGASLAAPVSQKLSEIAEQHCGERVVMTGGFGMTETAPSGLWIMQHDVQAGQLGIPSPGLEVKLVPMGDKQELRYRGPSVTPGYWRSPQQTREAFDEEGYFCSGDAVKWYDETRPELGFRFDGRIAEDFKLNTGTWVSVGPLRTRVVNEGAPYVQDAVITGHDRADLGVFLVPQVELCRRLSGLAVGTPTAEIIASHTVQAFFQTLVDRLHAQGTGSATRVARAIVLTDPPSMERGEATDKGSINQRAVLTHRAELVEALHANKAVGLLRPTSLQ